jgi:hypothetical protein
VERSSRDESDEPADDDDDLVNATMTMISAARWTRVIARTESSLARALAKAYRTRP